MKTSFKLTLLIAVFCCAICEAGAAEAALPAYYKYGWVEGQDEPVVMKVGRPQNYIEPYIPQDSELEILMEEVQWINLESIALAMEDMSKNKSYDAAKAKELYAELKALCATGFPGLKDKNADAVASAKKAVEIKRSILLSNPLLVDKSIVATNYKLDKGARHAMANLIGGQKDNWSPHINALREDFNASIVEISNLESRDKVSSKQLYHAPYTSSISELRLHWDCSKVLFTQTQEDKRWNVYEFKLDGDGTAEKVIINEEPDVEFFDATYLPDGRIIANSNIGYNAVPCVNGKDGVSNMVMYNRDTKDIRQMTFDQDSNWNPVVMNNGRVMYTRWEYTDLTHYYSRIIMHMNPDGTENKALYGSGSMFPNSTFDIKPLPGGAASFIGVISGHHGTIRTGRLILFDPLKSRRGAAGMLQEIPYRNRPIVEELKDRLVDESWPHFFKPATIADSDKYFLVAAKLSAKSLWGIYLVDIYDNVTCIMQTEGEAFSNPNLKVKVKTPPVIPDKQYPGVDGELTATFFVQDLYEGEGLQGVPRGTVKEVRLFAYEYSYLDTKSDHDWQGIQSGWDIKRQLGTVPVNEDGSVMFIAPANTPISIQPIDQDGVAVQWMRSWVVGQPNEVVSCVGCHEDQNHIAMPKRVTASMNPAVPLATPEGGIRSFTFDLEMQPILDRACIACHNGEEGKPFSLKTGKKDQLGFGPAYMNLMPYVRRQGGEGDMAVLNPYEYHPNTSELIRMLEKGHYNVKLTDEELRRIYAWIDHNAPDKGNFDQNQPKRMPYDRNPLKDPYARRIELKNKYAGGMGVDWKKEIADYAEFLKAKGEITPVMPEPMAAVKVKNVKAKGFPFSAEEAKAMQGSETKTIEVAPGVNMTFVRIPSGEFVMGSYNGDPDAYPTAKVKIDKAFWMAELEVTNGQVRALMPHDSKYVDQQWKDHVVPGYTANDDDQPAIRITYNEVVKYCKLLSEKSGLNITLPTEAQWEWAARAGSADDFWYGGLDTDFSTKENMADKTTLDFAVIGIDPKPMKTNNAKYKHYTYLPKDERSNDGSLIQVAGKKYEANPFGLYNMHGNVAEWTSSDYLPYPYKAKTKETSEYKVVRGGSYFERPKYSTSHTRKYYFPYQSVYNVGFRVIITE
ncbi:MAG: SUMF1/EgtB/PvdO family nonheme iron enzyme [Rikenellaceae bacterium]